MTGGFGGILTSDPAGELTAWVYAITWHSCPVAARRTSNGWPDLSTASRYATSLRATTSVARLRWPRATSRSWTAANCGFHLGASFAASTNTVCRCALRCLDIGPRCCLSAEDTNAEVRPQ